MTPIPINLAVEDTLSEMVCRKVLLSSGKHFVLGTVFGRGGFGYLKKTCKGWNRAAGSTPFMLLTDLDDYTCAGQLIADWVSNDIHTNFLFRVAVREVEAWLLGDRKGFAGFFKISERKVPDFPETLLDAKKELLRLVESSTSRDLRKRVIPKPGSLATQGPDYNSALSEFVHREWSPSQAAQACPSLRRCLVRIKEFEPVWS